MVLLVGCSMPQTMVQEDPRCTMIPEVGKCRAHFQKYYFDTQSVTCKAFVWGGCGGVVPFDSLETCEAACRPSR